MASHPPINLARCPVYGKFQCEDIQLFLVGPLGTAAVNLVRKQPALPLLE